MSARRAFILAVLLTTAILCFPEAVHSKEYKVGALLGLTGKFARFGPDLCKLLFHEAEQHNLNSKIKIKVIYQDHESNPTKAVHGLKLLTERYKVDAIIGPEVPMIAQATIRATSNKPQMILADIGLLQKRYNNVFSTMPTKMKRLEVLEKKIKNGPTRGLIMIGSAMMSQLAKEIGDKIGAKEYFEYKTWESLNIILRKIGQIQKQQKINLLFITRPRINIAQVPEFTALLIGMKNTDVFFLDPRDYFWGLSGSYPKRSGVQVVVAKYRYPSYGGSKLEKRTQVLLNLVNNIENRRLNRTSIFDAAAYDALALLRSSFQNSKHDSVRIISHLEGIRNFLGVSGVYSFGPKNHVGLGSSNFILATAKKDTGCPNKENECIKCDNCCALKEKDCPSPDKCSLCK